jgi:hypothetical protein
MAGIFCASEGGGYYDPDPYAYKPAKQKLKVGIITIYVIKNNKLESYQLMFAYVLILLIVKLEHLFHVRCLLIGALFFIPTLITVLG